MKNYDDLRELLDNEYDCQCLRFKVIVPLESLKQTEEILSDFILQYNYSKTKKFVSSLLEKNSITRTKLFKTSKSERRQRVMTLLKI